MLSVMDVPEREIVYVETYDLTIVSAATRNCG